MILISSYYGLHSYIEIKRPNGLVNVFITSIKTMAAMPMSHSSSVLVILTNSQRNQNEWYKV